VVCSRRGKGLGGTTSHGQAEEVCTLGPCMRVLSLAGTTAPVPRPVTHLCAFDPGVRVEEAVQHGASVALGPTPRGRRMHCTHAPIHGHDTSNPLADDLPQSHAW
jgi:hypothetical protein